MYIVYMYIYIYIYIYVYVYIYIYIDRCIHTCTCGELWPARSARCRPSGLAATEYYIIL